MKGFIWVLFVFFILVSQLYAQTIPPSKKGVMVVRKNHNSISKKDTRVTGTNGSSLTSSEVKSTIKRDPRYKGEPYVGKAEEVVVTIMDSNKKDLQYKYMDNALLLYGDFNTTPYTLYEIKSSISQKLYLYFNNKWFELKQNTKKTPLEEINNPSLVTYLNHLIKQ